MPLKALTGVDTRSTGVFFKQQLFEIWDITQRAKNDMAAPNYRVLMGLPLGYKIINDRLNALIATGISENNLVGSFFDVFGGSGTNAQAKAEYLALKSDVIVISDLIENNVGSLIPSYFNKSVVFTTPLSAGETAAITAALDNVISRFE